MTQPIETADRNEPLRAVLIGLQTDADEEGFERSLGELGALCEACMVEPVSVMTQIAKHPDHATFIGSGKVQELKAALYALHASLAIFDCSLTPIQVRNLGRILDTEVIDRTDLILRIFSERARTREARLQVEYARLDYLMPRLVGMRENLSRQGGASGFLSARGSGETQLELDRRKILNRQAQLRKELREVERVQETQRESRTTSGLFRVGLVGYTNAGKSTLLNRLLSMSLPDPSREREKQVFAKDMLFATLDTTVRRIRIKGRMPFILSDTVGFIRNLPTSLVKAFRSTLQEAAQADLLLEVVDCSDEDHEEQSETTRITLDEIGAGKIPRIRVMNKADVETLHHRTPGTIRRSGGTAAYDEVCISAKTGEGIPELLDLIEETLDGKKAEYTFLIPYTQGQIVTQMLESMEVLSRTHEESGTILHVRCGIRSAEKYREFVR